MKWHWYKFSELTVYQLYEILALRERVFTQEQKCTAVDIDGDDLAALHLIGQDNNKIVAYTRLSLPDKKAQIERIIVAKEYRNQGLGKEMLTVVLEYIKQHFPKYSIHLSAQTYLTKFYQAFGFEPYDSEYDDGGIPHIAMRFK